MGRGWLRCGIRDVSTQTTLRAVAALTLTKATAIAAAAMKNARALKGGEMRVNVVAMLCVIGVEKPLSHSTWNAGFGNGTATTVGSDRQCCCKEVGKSRPTEEGVSIREKVTNTKYVSPEASGFIRFLRTCPYTMWKDPIKSLESASCDHVSGGVAETVPWND